MRRVGRQQRAEKTNHFLRIPPQHPPQPCSVLPAARRAAFEPVLPRSVRYVLMQPRVPLALAQQEISVRLWKIIRNVRKKKNSSLLQLFASPARASGRLSGP